MSKPSVNEAQRMGLVIYNSPDITGLLPPPGYCHPIPDASDTHVLRPHCVVQEQNMVTEYWLHTRKSIEPAG